jgi:predicted metal-binding membrane protein
VDEQDTICCSNCTEYQNARERQPQVSHVMLPTHARQPVVWIVILLLAALAWIPTLQQTLGMLSMPMPMIGPMGMSLGTFLLFWTMMMVAMMFPALAPTVSLRFEILRRHASNTTACFSLFPFLVGYTLIWLLLGLPAFLLSLLDEYLIFHIPTVGIGLDIALLVGIGLYQMTSFKKRCLSYCNPTLGCHAGISSPNSPSMDVKTRLAPTSQCHTKISSLNSPSSHLKTGLRHGLHCAGACGGLMLVMVIVGFMNLLWMVLLTLVIFVEKTWSYGDRLSILMGVGLIILAVLAFINPTVLANFCF